MSRFIYCFLIDHREGDNDGCRSDAACSHDPKLFEVHCTWKTEVENAGYTSQVICKDRTTKWDPRRNLLSQGLSHISTNEDDRVKRDLPSTSGPSHTTAKRINISESSATSHETVNRQESEQEHVYVPANLSTASSCFDNGIQTKDEAMLCSMAIDDMRQVAIVKHRITALSTEQQIFSMYLRLGTTGMIVNDNTKVTRTRTFARLWRTDDTVSWTARWFYVLTCQFYNECRNNFGSIHSTKWHRTTSYEVRCQACHVRIWVCNWNTRTTIYVWAAQRISSQS
jgi:hypothetical protein